jgi:hypothetical protein
VDKLAAELYPELGEALLARAKGVEDVLHHVHALRGIPWGTIPWGATWQDRPCLFNYAGPSYFALFLYSFLNFLLGFLVRTIGAPPGHNNPLAVSTKRGQVQFDH